MRWLLELTLRTLRRVEGVIYAKLYPQIEKARVPLAPEFDPDIVPIESIRLAMGGGGDKRMIKMYYHGPNLPRLLEKLKRLGGHDGTAEVVARSLRYYEAALDARELGNKVLVCDKRNFPLLRLM